MKRRDFLKAAIAAIAVPTTAIAVKPETSKEIERRVCQAQPLRCKSDHIADSLSYEIGRYEGVHFVSADEEWHWKSWNEAHRVLDEVWFERIENYV